MNYSVLWRDVAEAALLATILRAADKPALWATARVIDRRLQLDPHGEGESRAVSASCSSDRSAPSTGSTTPPAP